MSWLSSFSFCQGTLVPDLEIALLSGVVAHMCNLSSLRKVETGKPDSASRERSGKEEEREQGIFH